MNVGVHTDMSMETTERRLDNSRVYARKSESKALNRTVTVVLFAFLLRAGDQDPYESNVFWYDGRVGGVLIGQWAGHSRRFLGGAGSSLHRHRRFGHALAHAIISEERYSALYSNLLEAYCIVLDGSNTMPSQLFECRSREGFRKHHDREAC